MKFQRKVSRKGANAKKLKFQRGFSEGNKCKNIRVPNGVLIFLMESSRGLSIVPPSADQHPSQDFEGPKSLSIVFGVKKTEKGYLEIWVRG